jgi:hypothetical protein
VRLVDDDVVEGAARHLLVGAGRREVHVAGHVLSRRDEDLRDEVLGSAALVGGHDVGESVVVLHGLEQVVEGPRPGIGLVAEHHRAPLPVAHRRGPGVGQQVDVDVPALEQEGVVASLPDRLLALLARRHGDRLDHLDAVRLGVDSLVRVHGSGSFRRTRAPSPRRMPLTVLAPYLLCNTSSVYCTT